MQQDEQLMAKLLNKRECPVGYRCLAVDCVECMRKYIEEGEDHEQSQDAGLQQTLHTE